MGMMRRKRKALIREVQVSWNSRIPASGRMAIVASVLDNLVVDLETEVNRCDLATTLRQAKFRTAPAKHLTVPSYLKSAVLANLFGKCSLQIPGINPREAAERRFDEAEMLCRQTNKRLIHFRRFDFTQRPLVKRVLVHEVFHLARRKIGKWLEPYEPEDLFQYTRHGPGGCGGGPEAAIKRPFTTPYYKFAKSHQGVTEGAYFLYLRAIAQSDTWISAIAQSLCLSRDRTPNLSVMSLENRIQLADSIIEIAKGGTVGFVPKNFETFRSIVSEPQGNVYCQLGVGGILRDALLHAGCNLNDQSRNQELAYAGSIDDGPHGPCTLDITMASDCTAIELVRELFEPKWFELFDSLRSDLGLKEGKWFKFAKFSSMGNGFTFELESMIFYALAQAASDIAGETAWYADTFGPRYKYGQVSVYGDDIIVPKPCFKILVDVLRFCGYRPNEDKSFSEGSFRESCGSDWFDGSLVRTAYFKGDLSRVREVVQLRNVLKWNDRLLKSAGLAGLPRTLEFVDTLLNILAPTVFRHLRNTRETLGQSYIWCEPDEVMTSALVEWDVDMQSWLMPEMRTRLVEEHGNRLWRYVQFLYAASGDREPVDTDMYEYLASVNPLAAALGGGGSAGDIMLAARDGAGKVGWVSRCESTTPMDLALIAIASV